MASLTPVRIEVSGLRAQGLRAADSNGLSDPYATVKVGTERYRTETCKETLDPVWKDVVMVFGKKQDLTKFDAIKITLWDEDMIGKDRLGEVMLPFTELYDRPEVTIEGWRPVYYSGAVQGR